MCKSEKSDVTATSAYIPSSVITLVKGATMKKHYFSKYYIINCNSPLTVTLHLAGLLKKRF